MKRLSMLSLLAAALGCLAAGCAFECGAAQPEATPQCAATDEEPPAEVAPEAAPAGADILERSRLHKEALDDGRDILEELASPIDPVWKTRTYGPLVQVSFTRVGGDDDVDASRTEDLIAFSSNRHSDDHNIYTKSISGSVVTQKTFKPFDEIQPKFSPDGTRIAFASNKNGNYDIWLIDTHGSGAAVQVTFGDEDDLHPAWAPAGDAVFYSSYSSRTGGWSIWEANLATGEKRDLGPGKFPEVSPDGKRILFQRARQRDGYWYSIWTMNLDGTDQTEVVTSADSAAINPCWSPDGQWIAFATVNKSPEAKLENRIWQGDDIYIIGVNGRGMFQLTADSEPDWAPCWSARDGNIYFVSERNGFRNIWCKKPPVFSVASGGTEAIGGGN